MSRIYSDATFKCQDDRLKKLYQLYLGETQNYDIEQKIAVMSLITNILQRGFHTNNVLMFFQTSTGEIVLLRFPIISDGRFHLLRFESSGTPYIEINLQENTQKSSAM